MKTTLRKIQLLIPLALLLVFAAVGCKEDAISPQQNNLQMSTMGSPDSVDTGLLVLSEVKLLIKDIKLNVSNSNQDSTNFKVGPYLINISPNLSVNYIDATYIPPGTYDKVRFMVHKLDNSEPIPDPDFADTSGRYSVVVKGTFAGVAFTYKSDKSAHQKLTSTNSLIIGGSDFSTNITLRVKPYIWFIKNGIYLDPADPNNRNDIDNNIKDNINNNFKCYKDNNKDGVPD